MVFILFHFFFDLNFLLFSRGPRWRTEVAVRAKVTMRPMCIAFESAYHSDEKGTYPSIPSSVEKIWECNSTPLNSHLPLWKQDDQRC